MYFKPAGLATGIGSVPFTGAGEALSMIFSNLPEIPHWPQMPGKGPAEGFVFQFLNPLVKTGLISIEGDRFFFDTGSHRWWEGVSDFYAHYLAAVEGDRRALEFFSLPEEAASGFYAFMEHIGKNGPGEAVFFKGQLAGPLTVGFSLNDRRGMPAYYNEQLRELLVKALALSGRWQAEKLSGLGRPAIIFIDEPAVSVYGKSGYITVTREMIKKDLDEISGQIHAAGAVAGVHSCDAIDWSILCQCDIEIINLDAYSYGESLLLYTGELKEFLDRGGALALGMAPTGERAAAETVESLWQGIEKIWEGLRQGGVTAGRLPEQTMITPACGTGLLEPALAERIYRLTAEISRRLREMAAK